MQRKLSCDYDIYSFVDNDWWIQDVPWIWLNYGCIECCETTFAPWHETFSSDEDRYIVSDFWECLNSSKWVFIEFQYDYYNIKDAFVFITETKDVYISAWCFSNLLMRLRHCLSFTVCSVDTAPSTVVCIFYWSLHLSYTKDATSKVISGCCKICSALEWDNLPNIYEKHYLTLN